MLMSKALEAKWTRGKWMPLPMAMWATDVRFKFLWTKGISLFMSCSWVRYAAASALEILSAGKAI
jgi:hypothetical protein